MWGLRHISCLQDKTLPVCHGYWRSVLCRPGQDMSRLFAGSGHNCSHMNTKVPLIALWTPQFRTFPSICWLEIFSQLFTSIPLYRMKSCHAGICECAGWYRHSCTYKGSSRQSCHGPSSYHCQSSCLCWSHTTCQRLGSTFQGDQSSHNSLLCTAALCRGNQKVFKLLWLVLTQYLHLSVMSFLSDRIEGSLAWGRLSNLLATWSTCQTWQKQNSFVTSHFT